MGEYEKKDSFNPRNLTQPKILSEKLQLRVTTNVTVEYGSFSFAMVAYYMEITVVCSQYDWYNSFNPTVKNTLIIGMAMKTRENVGLDNVKVGEMCRNQQNLRKPHLSFPWGLAITFNVIIEVYLLL